MTDGLKIIDVVLAGGNGSFFYDDQAAIRAGVSQDGFRYVGSTLTPGFTSIREPAQSLSIGLVLEDQTIKWGDMMGVQYSGAAGRDPLFRSDAIESTTRAVVVPRLLGTNAADFLSACAAVFAPHEGKRLPLAIEYGVSQALLRAEAHRRKTTMAEVLCAELDLPLPTEAVPLYAQSGDAREINVDKMILRSVDILPHGLINTREKFGRDGTTFRSFVKWVARRSTEIGREGYRPTLHFDLYGWVGLELGLDVGKIADFVSRVADDVPGFRLHIESPADFGSTAAQIEAYAELVELLDQRGGNARIVVDEHCNTLEDIELFARHKAAHLAQIKMPDVGSIADSAKAVLVCRRHGVGAYLGGSCTETDLSARASVHVAVATQADMLLAKPGMGVDEGLSIVGNEQNRLLSLLRRSRDRGPPAPPDQARP